MTDNNQICQGCLSSGRKLQLLSEFWKKHWYELVLSDKRMFPLDKEKVLICWECETQLANFIRFKRRAATAASTIKDLRCDVNKDISQIKKLSKLEIVTLNSINIVTQNENNTEDIKLENDPEIFDKEDLKSEGNHNEEMLISLSPIDCTDHCSEKHVSESEEKVYGTRDGKKKGRGKTKKGELVSAGVKKVKKAKHNHSQDNVDVFDIITLNIEEINVERSVLASKPIYANSSIKCEKCIVAFANVEDFSDHMKDKHELKKYKNKCEICECLFRSDMSFNYHMNKHYKRYKCVVCGELSLSQRAFMRHYNKIHVGYTDTILSEPNFVCKEENNTELPIEQSNNEDADEERSATYACENCNKVFKWKTSLIKHLEIHRIQSGEKRKPYCEICGLTFATTTNLQKHCKTSTKHQIKLQLNNLPGASEENADKIRKDITSSKSQFPCPHCDKRFQWRGNLVRHLHSVQARAAGSLRCVPCQRNFSSLATYTQHMSYSKPHVSDKASFKCEECGKKFRTKAALKDHVNWEHLKNFVHKCTVCDKVFKTHTSLYLHKNMVHRQDDGGHLCDHCGRSFPNQNKLRMHITALHTSEQPYKCRLCTATFSWHSCLSRHVKVVHHKIKVKRKSKIADDNI